MKGGHLGTVSESTIERVAIRSVPTQDDVVKVFENAYPIKLFLYCFLSKISLIAIHECILVGFSCKAYSKVGFGCM